MSHYCCIFVYNTLILYAHSLYIYIIYYIYTYIYIYVFIVTHNMYGHTIVANCLCQFNCIWCRCLYACIPSAWFDASSIIDIHCNCAEQQRACMRLTLSAVNVREQPWAAVSGLERPWAALSGLEQPWAALSGLEAFSSLELPWVVAWRAELALSSDSSLSHTPKSHKGRRISHVLDLSAIPWPSRQQAQHAPMQTYVLLCSRHSKTPSAHVLSPCFSLLFFPPWWIN